MEKPTVNCYRIGNRASLIKGSVVKTKQLNDEEVTWFDQKLFELEQTKDDPLSYDKVVNELSDFFDPVQHYVEKIKKSKSGFVLENGCVKGEDKYGNLKVVHGLLAKHIKDYLDRGFEQQLSVLSKFWRKCLANEDYNRIDGLFEFLNQWDFAVTASGNVIGYKKVNANINPDGRFQGLYMDFIRGEGVVKHVDGTFVSKDLAEDFKNFLSKIKMKAPYDNKTPYVLGEWTECENYDPDKAHLCSTGLHIGSLSYVNSFYGNVILCAEFSPEDVISPGGMYGSQGKIRCKKLKPIAIVGLDKVEKSIEGPKADYWQNDTFDVGLGEYSEDEGWGDDEY